MSDLRTRAEAVISAGEEMLSGGGDLQGALDDVLKLRRECAMHGENDLAYRLWVVEKDLWARLNPPRGGGE
jgi:hypothetical protein